MKKKKTQRTNEKQFQIPNEIELRLCRSTIVWCVYEGESVLICCSFRFCIRLFFLLERAVAHPETIFVIVHGRTMSCGPADFHITLGLKRRFITWNNTQSDSLTASELNLLTFYSTHFFSLLFPILFLPARKTSFDKYEYLSPVILFHKIQKIISKFVSRKAFLIFYYITIRLCTRNTK